LGNYCKPSTKIAKRSSNIIKGLKTRNNWHPDSYRDREQLAVNLKRIFVLETQNPKPQTPNPKQPAFAHKPTATPQHLSSVALAKEDCITKKCIK
jgi:hypothetical protein